jgi:hypothetical protein
MIHWLVIQRTSSPVLETLHRLVPAEQEARVFLTERMEAAITTASANDRAGRVDTGTTVNWVPGPGVPANKSLRTAPSSVAARDSRFLV